MNRRTIGVVAMAAALAVAGSACSSQDRDGWDGTGPVPITLWTHSAGNEGEMEVISQIIDDYNASTDAYEVVRQDFPQDAYNTSVQGAAASNDLPCILDVDGPIMPNWAWNGWLVPSGLTESDVANFLPSTVGRYNDEIYTVGYWDATTVMFSRRSVLEGLDIRIPTVEQPWTASEFDDALRRIQDSGQFDHAVDWGPSDQSEWYTYAFSPLLQSFGGDLVDRNTYASADGVLNSPESLAFAEWFQNQFDSGLAPRSNAQDRTEFRNERVAIQYSGNWGYLQNYTEFGDDLLVLPPPDFGDGPKVGVGSWQYGLTRTCTDRQREGALEYLRFSMQDRYIAQFSDVTSLIPATTTAAELTTSGYYGPGEPLEFLTPMSEQFGLVRPVTPAYPVISQVFQQQFQNLVAGEDPEQVLDQSVREIDADINAARYNR
ncbi:ABC transporter substrate-binding protein [Propioniciclava soli]|uniref:ABC transporter substrate-binding protein n=1 Tax=Propioniciclava soli TaxID=2775081 RepID=UPI001E580143|nr:extracellular solute-binding protein [Propioniciclava soli]